MTGNILDDGLGNVETATGVEAFDGTKLADAMTRNAQANTSCGQGGKDVLNGAGGNDTLYDGAGSDTLSGGAGDDSLSNDDGADKFFGGAGNDILMGGTGKETFFGGVGNDELKLQGLSIQNHGANVDLSKASQQIIDDGYGNVETVTGVESIRGTTDWLATLAQTRCSAATGTTACLVAPAMTLCQAVPATIPSRHGLAATF